MPALDAIAVQAVSATLSPAAAAAGDSLLIRSFPPPFKAHLLNVFTQASTLNTTTGLTVEIKSPRLHDAVHGIHLENQIRDTVKQPDGQSNFAFAVSDDILESQDTIEVDIKGDGVANHIDSVVLQPYYEHLDGVNGQLITTDDLKNRTLNGGYRSLVQVQLTTAAATLGWQSPVAITQQYDILKANRSYALLGFIIANQTVSGKSPLVVAMRSSDTGNLRAACPANPYKNDFNSNYFVYLSKRFEVVGAGLIPVFNASNKGSMIVDCISPDQVATNDVIAVFQLLD